MTDKPTINIDQSLLKSGLDVQVVVVRGDGKVVDSMPFLTAMSRLTGAFLRELPDKKFGQDKRDMKLTEALRAAAMEEKRRFLSIGRKPWVWR